MMKKTAMVCALFMAAQAAVFGQAKNAKTAGNVPKNAVLVDLVPLVRSALLEANKAGFGLGLMYERLVGEDHSAGFRGEFVTVDDNFYWGIELHGRWYPLSAHQEKPFIDILFGYGNFTSGSQDAGGLNIGIRGGFKFPLPFVKNFFAETTLGYTLAKNTSGYGPGGFGISLSVGCRF
jgi:hypothetical protein